MCLKTVVALIFRQRYTKDNFYQKLKIVFYIVHSVCLKFLVFKLWFVEVFFKYMLMPLHIFKFLYIINIRNIFPNSSVLLNTFYP